MATSPPSPPPSPRPTRTSPSRSSTRTPSSPRSSTTRLPSVSRTRRRSAPLIGSSTTCRMLPCRNARCRWPSMSGGMERIRPGGCTKFSLAKSLRQVPFSSSGSLALRRRGSRSGIVKSRVSPADMMIPVIRPWLRDYLPASSSRTLPRAPGARSWPPVGHYGSSSASSSCASPRRFCNLTCILIVLHLQEEFRSFRCLSGAGSFEQASVSRLASGVPVSSIPSAHDQLRVADSLGHSIRFANTSTASSPSSPPSSPQTRPPSPAASTRK